MELCRSGDVAHVGAHASLESVDSFRPTAGEGRFCDRARNARQSRFYCEVECAFREIERNLERNAHRPGATRTGLDALRADGDILPPIDAAVPRHGDSDIQWHDGDRPRETELCRQNAAGIDFRWGCRGGYEALQVRKVGVRKPVDILKRPRRRKRLLQNVVPRLPAVAGYAEGRIRVEALVCAVRIADEQFRKNALLRGPPRVCDVYLVNPGLKVRADLPHRRMHPVSVLRGGIAVQLENGLAIADTGELQTGFDGFRFKRDGAPEEELVESVSAVFLRRLYQPSLEIRALDSARRGCLELWHHRRPHAFVERVGGRHHKNDGKRC